MGLHYLEMFAVLPKDRFLFYVSMSNFLQNCGAKRIFCVPLSLVFAHYFSAIGDHTQRFICLLLKTAIKWFLIMSLVCLIQAVEYSTADLFLSARLWGVTEGGRLLTNGFVLVPLPCEMRRTILKSGLLFTVSHFMVDPEPTILALRALARMI